MATYSLGGSYMIRGQKQIKVIQGDSYQLNVSVANAASTIDHIVVSSDKLSIKKTLTFDSTSNKYVFTLTAAETTNLQKGTYDYDLTIFFTDTNVQTVAYRADIVVLPKTNPAV